MLNLKIPLYDMAYMVYHSTPWYIHSGKSSVWLVPKSERFPTVCSPAQFDWPWQQLAVTRGWIINPIIWWWRTPASCDSEGSVRSPALTNVWKCISFVRSRPSLRRAHSDLLDPETAGGKNLDVCGGNKLLQLRAAYIYIHLPAPGRENLPGRAVMNLKKVCTCASRAFNLSQNFRGGEREKKK